MFTKFLNFFASSDAAYEQKASGFAQFVLLLSLSPAILTLDVFSFWHSTPPPQYYDIDVARFETVVPQKVVLANTAARNACDDQGSPKNSFAQSFFDTKFGKQVAAAAAQAKTQEEIAENLPEAEREFTQDMDIGAQAKGMSPDQYQQWFLTQDSRLRQLFPQLGANPTRNDVVMALAQMDYLLKAQKAAAISPANGQCSTYIYSKPAGKLIPKGQYGGFIDIGSDNPGPVAWLFILSLILWFPAAWICLRRRQFDLLLCGSAMLAALAFRVARNDLNDRLSADIATYIAPKIPLLWFVFRGRVLSKAFLAFIVLMSASALLSVVPNLPLFFMEIAVFAIVFAILYFLARWIMKAPAAVGEAYFPRAVEPVRALDAKLGGRLLLALVFTFFVFEFGSVFYHGAVEVFQRVPVLSMLKALLPIVVFVMTIGLMRLVILAAKENAYFLRNLGWRRCLRVGAQTALYWTPMAVLAFPYLWATEYALPFYAQHQLFQDNVLIYDYGHDLRDNVLQSTATKFDDKIFQFHVDVKILEDEVSQETNALTSEDLTAMAMSAFDQVIPTDLTLGPVDVGEQDVTFAKVNVQGPVNAGANLALSSVASAYQSLRATIRQNISNAVAAQQAKLKSDVFSGATDVLSFLETTRTTVIPILKGFNQQAQNLFSAAIAYWNGAHFVSLLLFGFICVKSFLYVFARVAFNRDAGTFVTLGRTEGEVPIVEDAQITQTGSSYVIPAGTVGTFYVSRKFQARGKAPRFAIPQPLHGPIARILHGKVTMNKVVMHAEDKGVTLTSTKGQQFIEWDVREGETVLFNFRNFVGMSEELHISTLISVRLSTLLLGEIIYSTATGPGKLILETSGRAEITRRDQIADSLPPERMVAMPRDTRMYVESELGPVDVYLSSAYIRPEMGGQMIIDVDSQRGAGMGLGRFFLHFIWPG